VVKNQAVKENVETPAHLQVKAGAVGRFPSLRGILLGICKAPAWHHAHKGFLAAYLLDGSLGSAVGKAKVVVNQSHLLLRQLPAGGVNACSIAKLSNALRLVDGHKVSDASLEALGDDTGVTCKNVRNLPVQPAALILQGAGQIPVVEGNQRLNPARNQFIYQIVVKTESLFVDLAVTVRYDSRPTDGEAVCLDIKLLHQRHILPVAMVAVAGYVAGVPVFDVVGSGVMAEIVPDIGAFPILIPGTFALIRCAGNTP